jgi:hypothetical protein
MKKLLLTLLAVMVTVAVNAERVSKQEALMKARQFMPDKQFGEAKVLARSGGVSEVEPFYIFNAENNGGFVIVSGDNRMKSILGYSEHGRFDLDKIPENVRWWLEQYKKAAAVSDGESSLSKTRKSATRGDAEIKDDVEPFITTTWGQGYPYNKQCPIINEQNCLTGCVATAMAQVINYTKWPKKGLTTEAKIPFYKTKTNSINMPALEKTEFDWENMTDDEIAKLMLYCGQSVKMDYGIEGSGASDAYIPQGMIWYFGFDRGLKITYRKAYDTKDWNTILYEELRNKRPIIYGGQSGSDGHSFIIHGYQDGMYYVNWGWNGNYDGFYELTALNPTYDQSYTKDQIAIIGIQAPNGEDDSGRPRWSVEIITMEGLQEMERVSSSSDFPAFTIKNTLGNNMFEDAVVSVGYGLFRGNTLIKVLSQEKINASVGENITYESSISFGKDLSDGVYQIKVISRGSEVEEWQPVEGSGYRFVESEIKGNTMINSIKPEFEIDERLQFNIIKEGEVEVLAANPNIDGDIVIPAIIKIDDKEYKVTQVAMNGFQNTEIQSITFPETLETIESGAFSDCLNITNVTFPSSLKEIGFYAFYNTQIETIVLPMSIVNIYEGAFGNNSKVRDVTIPKSVKEFYNPFGGCSNLAAIHVEEGSPSYFSIDGVVYQKKQGNIGLTLKAFPSGKEDKNYIIPDDCIAIDESAFLGNNNITKIVMPEGLEKIYRYAFLECDNLSNVVIPQTVNYIGACAFRDCPSLRSITVKQARAISISEDVFDKETYEQSAFYVPKGRSSHYMEQIGWGEFKNIEEVEMPDVTFVPELFTDLGNNQMILGFYSYSNDADDGGMGGEIAGLYKAAIKLSEARMSPFTNNIITHIRFGLGGRKDMSNINKVKVWISSSLEGDLLYSQDVESIQKGWNIVELNKPFFIDGKEICIGYEFQMKEADYPISVTHGMSSWGNQCESEEEGAGYFYSPTYGDKSFHWHREKGLEICYDAVCIQALVEGDNIPKYDLRPLSDLCHIKKYYTSNESFGHFGYVMNCGKKRVNNYDLGVTIDDGEKTIFHGDESINSQKAGMAQWYLMAEPGKHILKLFIDKINGNTPIYTKDDTLKLELVVLKEPITRHKTLVEYYTTNSRDIKEEDDVYHNTIKDVSILAVHLDDELTCKAGEELSRLSVFCPGSSIPDRAKRKGDNSQLGDCYPMVDGSRDNLDLLASVADIEVDAKYSTNNLIYITVKGFRTKDFFNLYENTNLYVMLTEDGVIAPQIYDNAMVENYSHNWVLRANVSNIWGDPIVWNGDKYEMTYIYKLKDTWKRENMKVVAFLGNPFSGENYDDLQVLNCNDFELKNATLVDIPDIFEKDNIVYKKQNSNCVAISYNNSVVGELVIPKTVKHDGIEYIVKAICEDAFKGDAELNKVTIPESIEIIGNRAFAGCIGLEAIYSYAKEPIELGSAKATVPTRADGEEVSAPAVFAEVDKETCILYVPKNSSDKYRAAEGWGEFQNIVEMESNLQGDANNDGKVDDKDIEAVTKYIMDGNTKGFIYKNADVNGDKKINAADIVLIVNLIK